MRYMLPSNGSVQDPVFIFGSYSENMEEFLDTNIGLRRRIKLKFISQDYFPVKMQNSFSFESPKSFNRML